MIFLFSKFLINVALDSDSVTLASLWRVLLFLVVFILRFMKTGHSLIIPKYLVGSIAVKKANSTVLCSKGKGLQGLTCLAAPFWNLLGLRACLQIGQSPCNHNQECHVHLPFG